MLLSFDMRTINRVIRKEKVRSGDLSLFLKYAFIFLATCPSAAFSEEIPSDLINRTNNVLNGLRHESFSPNNSNVLCDGRRIAAEPCTLVEDDGSGPVLLHDSDPNKKTTTLTPFWAQEYIGSDLVQDVLDTVKTKPELVSLGLVDQEFTEKFYTGSITANATRRSPEGKGEHGTAVANLMSGRAPYGVAKSAEITDVILAPRIELFPEIVGAFLESPPKVVNISMPLREGVRTAESLNRLSEKTILVMSAGNTYPTAMDVGKQYLKAIFVGSLSPEGLMTQSSTEGPNVTIAAPSDYWIQSIHDEKGRSTFGATSGATPLVSGAVANVVALLPDITPSEVATLLKRTAVPTANSFEKPQKNGAGMLNALKLVEVAKRLQELGWPKNRSKLISKAKLYDFENQANEEIEQGRSLLMKDDTCSKSKGLRLLRKGFLLSPNQKRAGILAEAYRRLGYTTNAAFYGSLSKPELLNQIAKRLPDEDTSWAKYFSPTGRAITALGREAIPLVEKSASSLEPKIRIAGIMAAGYLEKGGVSILKHATSSEAVDERVAAARVSWRISAKEPEVLAHSLNDPDSKVRKAAVESLKAMIPAELSVLKAGLSSSYEEIRSASVQQAWKLKKKEADSFLRAAIAHSDPNVRASALRSMSKISASYLPYFESGIQDSSPRVRQLAVIYAVNLGSIGAPIVEAGAKDKDLSVRQAVLEAAPALADRGLPIIESLTSDSNENIRNDAKRRLETLQNLLSTYRGRK